MINRKGHLIVLEGPDGSGKSTQIKKLDEYLKKEKIKYIMTREPGGTKLGEKVREIILHEPMSKEAEVYLYAACRAELVEKKIKPALEEGLLVISDRFLFSSLAYQGSGREVGIERVFEINKLAFGDILPDLTIFLDLSPAKAIERKKEQKKLDRLEEESISFHNRVYDGYNEAIKLFPERVVSIDAELSEDAIFHKIIGALKNLEVIR
ncbi:MAG: dTMP kinase [Tissierellia bacterium]|nr:dTMP kinase [Tissierellia bacterium]